MPHSHHSHSGTFCHHAKSTLEEVVQEAIKQGFKVYGLSEHAPRWRVEDLYPEEWRTNADKKVELNLRPEDLRQAYLSFLDEAVSLREKYKDRISLLIGLETDWITPLDSSGLTRLLNEEPRIEYIVGSIHHVLGVPIDFSRDLWLSAVYQASLGIPSSTMRLNGNESPELVRPDTSNPRLHPSYSPSTGELLPFLLAYFDAQYELITTYQPEVIGHFDLCLLYTPSLDLRSPDLPGVYEKVQRNVRAVVGYGGLFEANSAALRKGWSTSYPGEAILEFIVQEGGRICLSDDSHGVSQVGLNYPRMKAYLQSTGVERVWYLVPSTLRRPGDQNVGNRNRVVARKCEDWASHPFWEALPDR